MKSREDVASAAQRNPVSPSVAIMGAEDEDGEEEEDDDEVLKFDEEVEKKAAVVDGRCVRKLADPRRPSQAEVDEHELTHIPYRNWCAVCVCVCGAVARTLTTESRSMKIAECPNTRLITASRGTSSATSSWF